MQGKELTVVVVLAGEAQQSLTCEGAVCEPQKCVQVDGQSP